MSLLSQVRGFFGRSKPLDNPSDDQPDWDASYDMPGIGLVSERTLRRHVEIAEPRIFIILDSPVHGTRSSAKDQRNRV